MCFRVTGRTTWYLEPEEIQRDLDRFLAYHNLERSHQGYRLMGRTPAQALREALGIESRPRRRLRLQRDVHAEGRVSGRLVT